MADDKGDKGGRLVLLDPRNIWRVGLVVLGLIALALFIQFLLEDGGNVIFIVLMSWFASLAMEPAVRRLSVHMKRGLATGIVMIGVVIAIALFSWAFGALLVDQITQIITSLPSLIDLAIAWINNRFGTNYGINDILAQLNLEPSDVAGYAGRIVGGILGVLGSVVGGFVSLFTFALFTFYLSADGPRLRRYLVGLFATRFQGYAMQVWDLTAEKTGNYVAARVVLAFINGSTSALVFWAIGMPYWLALGIWTGVVAQFVPTIGTYIAIALPVLVGLLSPEPWIGIAALVWALIYQQVENLTIEPRISARAVDVHPAVAFAIVLLGAALFGVAGALLAIPVGAMLIAFLEVNRKRYELDPALFPESKKAP